MEALKKKISKQYKKAGDEVEKKLDNYLRGFESRDEKKKEDLDNGLISEKDYKEWRRNQILTGQRWKELRDNLAKDYTNMNVSAMKMTREAMREVFAENFNYGTFEAEIGSGISTSFTLYDIDSVTRLLIENPKILPDPKVDIPKDLRWNAENLTSTITQGILQGDSIPKIAKLLDSVTGMGRNAALRNARTMMTAAQNAGRIDSYRRAEDMGIKLKKTWLSAPDNRVRDTHAALSGESIGIDDVFSNGLRYPADPDGSPDEVYNCRCTLIAEVEGHEHGLRENRSLMNMNYKEWRESKGG